MTVNTYFGTAADYIFGTHPIDGQNAVILEPGVVKAYSAVTGGTQLDMTVNGQVVTSITVGNDGQIPAADIDSTDPDGAVWVSINDGPRVRAVPQGLRGPTGDSGPQGPPGTDGAPGGSDQAFHDWIELPDSLTRTALDNAFAKRIPQYATQTDAETGLANGEFADGDLIIITGP